MFTLYDREINSIAKCKLDSILDVEGQNFLCNIIVMRPGRRRWSGELCRERAHRNKGKTVKATQMVLYRKRTVSAVGLL